ncbi:metallophosphoesterase [Aureibacillus halotolerans]|uniref:Calcineurin-like phosphoesterase domain-containing protein n=1 Tax=Aureibacillus halotolerans TaxID=1508390 RepID=A0A4R6U6V0_9BACI|nr:metallophosphoesterase [Aureibacillus halotolerans]TDQ42238.1 hypothetical protein EV213_102269 [Aureibacillus halotolerans]
MKNEKITRRSFIKRLFGWFTGLVVTATGGYSYATYLEPRWVETTHHTIPSKNLPKSFQSFKIVQVSDTHVGYHYEEQQLENLVTKINGLQPDLIVFSGDLMDSPNQYETPNHLTSILKSLKAPYGKIAVYGNHDHGDYGTNIYKNIMENAGFTVLLNQSTTIEKEGEHIVIAGIDDLMLGRPDLAKTMNGISPDDYLIFIAHEPDIAAQSKNLNISLQLSGHTHGGQVQLPFFGPIVLPPLGEKYFDGMYTFPNSDMILYVNRGIGTTRLPYRFFCRPELSVFTLERKT